ncbi:hypothetical protein [Brevibacterium limosum]|uniref:hypothetical protein n=1 Tax=Brevibacterium limosum TaxID=2697565 RepID=UPI00141DCDA5|nr:hypothetical protein [Brevibacterium limosum]
MDPDHGFVNAIAVAPTTTLPKETTGLRKRTEDLRILVRSYVDRLPPDAVFSHRSALIVHGLSIPFVDSDDVFAESVSPRSGVRLAKMPVRRRSHDRNAREIVNGAPVTTVLQTLLDVARDSTLAFSVAVLDSAVRSSVVTIEEIRSYCESHPVLLRIPSGAHRRPEDPQSARQCRQSTGERGRVDLCGAIRRTFHPRFRTASRRLG